MSLYLEQIRQLVSLQRVDDAIYDVETELKQAPQDMEALKARFASINAQREAILEKLAHLKEQEKRSNNEIEDDISRIRKSRSRMMQVSNSREYQAMVRELDNMERVNRSKEEERARLQEEKRRQSVLLQDIDSTWAELKADVETKQANFEAHIAATRKKQCELEDVRKATGAKMPKPVLERYEFIRRRLSHPVIVSVTNGVCSGCRIAIPPQTFIELQTGHKIINCPNCQRLIYWAEHFKDEAESAETGLEAKEQ